MYRLPRTYECLRRVYQDCIIDIRELLPERFNSTDVVRIRYELKRRVRGVTILLYVSTSIISRYLTYFADDDMILIHLCGSIRPRSFHYEFISSFWYMTRNTEATIRLIRRMSLDVPQDNYGFDGYIYRGVSSEPDLLELIREHQPIVYDHIRNIRILRAESYTLISKEDDSFRIADSHERELLSRLRSRNSPDINMS